MIVFSIDSAPYICELLKDNQKVDGLSIFFNHDQRLDQVIGFKNIEEYFDINGMTQTAVTGYIIQLNGGDELTVKLNGTKNQAMPFSCKLNLKPDFRVSPEVTGY